MKRYKEERKKGERTTMCVSFMLDVENIETWKSMKGKSRWINAKLAEIKKP